MKKYYKMDAKSRKLEEVDEVLPNGWINLENPSDKEVEDIVKLTGIPEEMLKASLDEEERARTECEGGNTLIIVDLPVINDDNSWYGYSTIPLAIIFNENFFVTVCLHGSSVINDFVVGRVRGFDCNKKSRFIYQILYANSIKFLHCLRQIDKTSSRIQTLLHKSMKNKELIQLLDLEKALVYFSTSLNANQIVIDKINSSNIVKHFEDDNAILDDVIIENRQAIEMATIYRDILSGTMDAFASVISNNQNIVMKLLTAITICLTIPNLVFSLWGMNVDVPFANVPGGFFIVLGIVVAILIPVIIWMCRKRMF